jgi:hypothetical protein
VVVYFLVYFPYYFLISSVEKALKIEKVINFFGEGFAL